MFFRKSATFEDARPDNAPGGNNVRCARSGPLSAFEPEDFKAAGRRLRTRRGRTAPQVFAQGGRDFGGMGERRRMTRPFDFHQP